MKETVSLFFIGLAIGLCVFAIVCSVLIHKVDERADEDIVGPFVKAIVTMFSLGAIFGIVGLILHP